MNTFKQFLIEQADLYSKEEVVTLVHQYSEGGFVDIDRRMTALFNSVIGNRGHYTKLFGYDIMYSGTAYRMLNLHKMTKNQKITDLRQLTATMQRYDKESNTKHQSWTKDKKIAIQGLKNNIWWDNMIVSHAQFATVTVEGNIKGLDFNKIAPDLEYANEQEVLAPMNIPVNIIGFSIAVPHGIDYPWKGKRNKFFSVGQFKEFAQLYNNILQHNNKKNPSKEDYKAKRERKKRSR